MIAESESKMRRTYKGHKSVKHLHEVDNVGQLEYCGPSMLVMVDFPLKNAQEAANKVGGNQTSKKDKDLLIDVPPWRVTNA